MRRARQSLAGAPATFLLLAETAGGQTPPAAPDGAPPSRRCRAVRTPSRTADDAGILFQPVRLQPAPLFPDCLGNRAQRSEELMAYEVGFREQTTERFSWDLSLFFHRYEKRMTNWIGSPTPGPGGVWFLPLPAGNAMQGEVYGAELALNYRPRPTSRIDVAYTFLQLAMHSAEGTVPMGSRSRANRRGIRCICNRDGISGRTWSSIGCGATSTRYPPTACPRIS
jgi:hypothetical protein